VVDLTDGADDARCEKGGSDVLNGVADHLAKNVADAVYVVADPRNHPGDEHQVLPVGLLVARDANHITITTTIPLKHRQQKCLSNGSNNKKPVEEKMCK